MTALMAVRGALRRPKSADGWKPSDLGASLVAWFDASDATTITYASGDLISEWSDKSGNGNHATQATGANQPNVASGSERVAFDGGDFLAASGISASSNSRCVAAVARVATGENNSQALIAGNNTGAFGLMLRATNAKVEIQNTNTAVLGLGSVFPLDADTVVLGNLTSTTWRITVDGTAWTGSHATTFTAGRTALIGKNQLGGTAYDWLNDSVREIVVCTALSTDDQQKLEGYLAHKWGLTANLPNDHPWKTTAP